MRWRFPWHRHSFMSSRKRRPVVRPAVEQLEVRATPTGNISGTVFHDQNGNATFDTGETGIQGVTVFLDTNNNGKVDSGETSTTTAADGTYTFTALAAASYNVREVVPSGFAQTTTNPAAVVISTSNVSGVNFGLFKQFTISGRAFVDVDGSGTEAATDPGLNGATIQLYKDVNGNGLFDQGTDTLITSTTTSTIGGKDGVYSFANQGAGKFIVKEVASAGRGQVFPQNPNTYAITAVDGLNVANLDFGNLGNANQSYVNSIYVKLLNRPADTVGLGTWVTQLNNGMSRDQVALAIESTPEYWTVQVQSYYQKYLGRAADVAGLNSFVSLLLQGATAEQVQADIIGSPEYFQTKGGGNNQAFLSAVYNDVLGRPIDSAGQTTFTSSLNLGITNTQVGFQILTSTEAQTKLVNGYYNSLLGRRGDPAGVSLYVGLLQQGQAAVQPFVVSDPNSGAVHDENVAALILGSTEYFKKV